MALFGSSWIDDPTPHEEYKEITGRDFHGTEDELRKEIEGDMKDLYISKTDRNKLSDLSNTMKPNE